MAFNGFHLSQVFDFHVSVIAGRSTFCIIVGMFHSLMVALSFDFQVTVI